jgi:DNA helicase HerA-like ATPase
VLFDEADLYLPALSKPPTKEPMENLLKRARSAGLGLLLATQSPGDFDYKCKENLHAWFVGLVKEKTALEKMKPMLSESRVDVSAKLPGQEVGQFFLIKEGRAHAIHAERSLIKTLQLSEAEILSLAAAASRGNTY